jgi:protein SCO1/2
MTTMRTALERAFAGIMRAATTGSAYESYSPAAAAGLAPSPTIASWDAARFLPDVLVQTHEGARVRFYEDLIRGRFALINFMFTTCTNQCPLATANLMKVQEALGERVGRDIVMVSVTVDSHTDTPAVLKRYSRRYGIRPGWYFVTGRQRDLDLIRRRLGVLDAAVDKTQHTGLLVLGNEATGQWAATPAQARPNTIVRSVMRLASS